MVVRSARLGGFVVTVAAAAGLLPAGQAAACSQLPMPLLEEVFPGQPIEDWAMGPVLGIYEFEFIAHSPGWLGPERSVTVVTRTWGTPPQVTGTMGVVEGCGNDPASVGESGYGWVEAPSRSTHPEWRTSISLGGIDGRITPDQETLLVDRFGPTVAIDVPVRARVTAFISVWRRELLVLAGLIGVAVSVLLRRRRPVGRRAADDRVFETQPD